ncbi:MAG: hypothetical protein IT566_06460 [Rhodospirillaceae bacterium]|nr:hypothetical protein [Rhodospirillaceae bacterium]
MKHILVVSTAALIAGLAGTAAAEDGALKDRTIGFVLTHKSFALWQSPDGKTECPDGVNVGPREQFKALYPNGGKFAETQLARDGEIMFPDTTPEPKLFFHEPVSKVGIGLNLDGKVDDNDFVSEDGKETGIDNQMYRVVGCTDNYRGPEGQARHFIQDYMRKFNYNRWLIEVTDVDDLTNDPDVTVSLYRGLDALTQDAAGNFTSGGTQRIDAKWGKEFMYKTKGKIEGGVLTTAPVDITFPVSQSRGYPYNAVKDWRVRLSLTSDGADGLMAGYLDLERWHHNLWQLWSSHHRSYGGEPVPSQYRSLRRNADAYPDSVTGENTHISAAWAVKFAQAFILHPDPKVAEKSDDGVTSAGKSRAAQD